MALHGGIADAVLDLPTLTIVEIKRRQTADGYYQLVRYAGGIGSRHARVLITSSVDLNIRTPENPQYLRSLRKITNCLPGGYYVIPWRG